MTVIDEAVIVEATPLGGLDGRDVGGGATRDLDRFVLDAPASLRTALGFTVDADRIATSRQHSCAFARTATEEYSADRSAGHGPRRHRLGAAPSSACSTSARPADAPSSLRLRAARLFRIATVAPQPPRSAGA